MENQKTQPMPVASNKWKTIAIIFIIISVLFAGLSAFFVVNSLRGKDDGKTQEKTYEGEEKDEDEEVAGSVVDLSDDKFAEYIIGILKQMAPTGYLLRSTIGDVDAPKVKVDEITANVDNYKATIKANLLNEKVIFDISEQDGIKTYIFSPEGVLNILGMGTHMGVGFPSTMNITGNEQPGGTWKATFTYALGN